MMLYLADIRLCYVLCTLRYYFPSTWCSSLSKCVHHIINYFTLVSDMAISIMILRGFWIWVYILIWKIGCILSSSYFDMRQYLVAQEKVLG